MRMLRRPLLTVLIVAAVALEWRPRPALAQQKESATEPRPVVVSVIDRHAGLPVRDLTKDDFRARNNGRPVTVVDAQFSTASRRILVLLDMSASMTERQSDKWAFVREAVGDLLRQAPADVRIGMLTFSKSSHEVFDFSQSRGAIAAWLDEGSGRQPRLKHREVQTALLDAIVEGAKMLAPVQPGDALYAITDGGENASHSTRVQAEMALLQSGVRLFTLCLPSFGTVEEREGADLLLEMVDDTGGFAFGVLPTRTESPTAMWSAENFADQGNRAKLERYTDELNAQVYGFWTLRVAAPSSTKQTKLSLEVVDGSGKARKDVLLTYPRLLAAKK
jgi:hypothetical protein